MAWKWRMHLYYALLQIKVLAVTYFDAVLLNHQPAMAIKIHN